jgi:uncharacterized spore protein YtfJ
MDVGNLLMKASDNLSVRRAFGTAYEKDGMLIIPVAMVAGGGGGGTARPRQAGPAAGPPSPEGSPPGQEATAQDSERVDTGGGFGGVVLPAGAYVVKGDQVRWVPAVDMTIVVLTTLGLARILARMWTRSGRRRSRP